MGYFISTHQRPLPGSPCFQAAPGNGDIVDKTNLSSLPYIFQIFFRSIWFRVLTEANKQNMKNRFWPKNQFEDIASRKFHHLQPILGPVPKTFYWLSWCSKLVCLLIILNSFLVYFCAQGLEYNGTCGVLEKPLPQNRLECKWQRH